MRSILIQILDGLGTAHVQGIWHRDIKPENIMLQAVAGATCDELSAETAVPADETSAGRRVRWYRADFVGKNAFHAPVRLW